MGMAKKMMGQMGSGGADPMAKGMGMAEKMMASGSQEKGASPEANPMMKMCRDMLGSIRQTTEMAAFATPELRSMFAEWLGTLEDEAVRKVVQSDEITAQGLAEALGISQESAAFLIARMIGNGKLKAHLSV
jgi:predicted HTH transcriptional regulator